MIFLELIHLRKKIHTKLVNFKKRTSDPSGQSFIEFLFLLLILMGLSITLVTGMNGTVAKQWSALVKAISLPNDSDDFQL